jgi:tetratricopeptide (TPR) repeat protein
MTEFGEFHSQRNKRKVKTGLNFGKLPVWCLWLAFATMAHGQLVTADWSSLTPPPSASDTNSTQIDFDATNAEPTDAANFYSTTNSDDTNGNYKAELAMAGYYGKIMQPEKAEPMLIGLLADNIPEDIQKSALLELGLVVRNENDLPRAQTIFAQFLNRWPDDPRAPEVFLRQGEIFRQMGLTDLALGKFYSVMAAALNLKNDQLPYYQKLVLQTQVEIADTHYLMGHYVDAADFYSRLLQNPDPGLDRPEMEFRLVRSLTIIRHNDEAASEAEDFLNRFPGADQTPEVRYYYAQALKALGRDDEALEQVIICLQQQKSKSSNDPTVWTYWQQRVGNEIGNQLYKEGDYVHALEIYADLAQLDSTATWQIPVDYQMGLTYEKLLQPQKAVDTYNQIIARENEVGTNATPGMKAIFGMAEWRVNYLKWQQSAQSLDQSLAAMTITNSSTNLTQ